MATRNRFRRALAGLLACTLIAVWTALTFSDHAAHQAGSAVLTAHEMRVSHVGTLAAGGCSILNVSCEIDSWFSQMAVSALRPLLNVVGQTGLSTPQVTSAPAVSGIWAGSLSVADSGFVLLILAGGMILMGYQTYQSSYTLKEVAPRLVIAMVAANTSWLFIPKAISLANAVSAAMAPGLPESSATQAMTRILLTGEPGNGIFLILLALVATVLAAGVAVTYVIRLMAVVLLTAMAPLALASYALPHTSWAARWWWRAFAAVLIIPVAQALVLSAAVKVFLAPGWTGFRSNPDLINMLITICLLYVMMRIPFWISRPALRPFGSGPLRGALRFAFGAAVLSRAGRALRGTSRAATPPGRRGAKGSKTRDSSEDEEWGIRQELAAYTTPLVRAARRVTGPFRPTAPPGGAPGAGAGTGGPPPPLPGGGSPAHAQPLPLPGGGTGRAARHAQAPPLPYGDDRTGTPPPLPGDPDRARPVPRLPGGAIRRARPPLPAAGIRSGQAPRRPQPPLPADTITPPGQPRPPGRLRRGVEPPLPAAGIQSAHPARRTPAPLPATGVGPAEQHRPPGRARSTEPPLPASGLQPPSPARRTAPPLPAAAVTPPGRSRRPPLPGGPARRGTAPPLPAAGIEPERPEQPALPADGLPRPGRHAQPPALPGGGTGQRARHAQVPPEEDEQ